jgi:hypothetical protein
MSPTVSATARPSLEQSRRVLMSRKVVEHMGSRHISSLATVGLALGLTAVISIAGCDFGRSGTPNAAPANTTLQLSFLQDPGQPPTPTCSTAPRVCC